MTLTVFHGSVLDVEADAVVNAANTELRHGGGVAAAIAAAAGPELAQVSASASPCPLGSAVATTAGRLRAKMIVHVPTVDYRAGGTSASADQLQAGTRQALRIAADAGCSRIAFPILGAGIAGIGAEDACRAMDRGIREAVDSGRCPPDIVVCAWSDRDRTAAARLWGPSRPSQEGSAT